MINCQMIVGLLVPRRCSRRARSQCIQCNRHFCDEHVTLTAAGLVCLACQAGRAEPVEYSETLTTFTSNDIDAFYENDDPFVDLS